MYWPINTIYESLPPGNWYPRVAPRGSPPFQASPLDTVILVIELASYNQDETGGFHGGIWRSILHHVFNQVEPVFLTWWFGALLMAL